MLAALDALIETGTGGRAVLVLKQACGLFMRVGFDGAEDVTSRFDEMMATLAMDLDPATLRVLAPELKRLPGVLPAFTSTVMSRFHEIELRAAETAIAAETVPDVPVEVEDTPVLPAPAAMPASAPPHAERRQAAREPTDPMTLARLANPAQLRAIAALPHLPEMLTGIILSRGDSPAIAAVLSNPGAEFARSSLMTAAELAAGDRDIRLALTSRDDLPQSVVTFLLPVIGREARARVIMSGTTIDVEAARQALAASQAALARDAAGGAPRTTIDTMRRDMADGRMTPTDVVRRLAADRRLAELAALATAVLGLDLALAHAMLTARLDQAAVVLVRALGATHAGMSDVLDMRQALGLRDRREARAAEQMSQQWTPEEARVTLTLVASNLPAATEPAGDVPSLRMSA
jgi:uncharacterized protein (DUF2336 family)